MRKNDIISGIEGASSSATAGSTATVNLPFSRRHYGHRLFTKGTKDNGAGVQVPALATDILETIRYLCGSVVMIDLTADELRKIYAANMKLSQGYNLADNEVPIPFAEPWRATVTDELLTAWETYQLASFTGRYMIKPGITGVGVSAKQVYDEGSTIMNGKSTFFPLKKTRVSVNATGGRYDITTLPIDLPLQRIWLYGTADIEKVEVYSASEKIFDSTREENARDCLEYGIDPTTFGVTNSFPLLFDVNQQLLGQALERPVNLIVRVYSSAAHQINCITEQRLPATYA